MAQTPEGKVKAAVCKILDAHGAYYFKPPANGYGRQGIPDVVGCKNGRFFSIECKAGKGKTTVLQEMEIARIRQADGFALVVNETNLDAVEALMVLL
jgi:Holliday junction resolvase